MTKRALLLTLLVPSLLIVSPVRAAATEEGNIPTLSTILGKGDPRKALVRDCADLVDRQVAAKSGLSGFVIKGGYGVIKAVREGFVPGVIDSLLTDWLKELEPFYQDWQKTKQGTFSAYLTARSGEVSEALLKVTDRRVKKSRHATIRGIYDKLRDSARDNVTAAVPELAKILEAHLLKP